LTTPKRSYACSQIISGSHGQGHDRTGDSLGLCPQAHYGKAPVQEYALGLDG